MKHEKYTIKIEYDEDDNCYIAEVLELENCKAHGSTYEEALREIKIAMEEWLQVAKEMGYEIPKPLSLKSYSGKLTLRIPPSKHKELVIEAKTKGISLNKLISQKL